MKKNKKRKLKKQLIFNVISIVFVLTIGSYFLGRLIYYKIDNDKEKVYSDIFYKRIIEQNDTYELSNHLAKTNSIYRFVGDVDNNYVQYKGYLWRILRINKDNSVSLITEDTVTSLAYSGSLKNYILAWLNISKENNTGIFEKSLEENKNLKSTRICFDTFKEIEGASCFEYEDNYKIGLLGIDDYIKAGANESYLNNGKNFWSSNSYDSTHAWYIAEDGLVSNEDYANKYGIRPIITLSGDTKVLNGDGTSENPYILEKHDITNLNDSYVGEYLTFNNTLWRIVAKDTNKIKIVSTECLKDNNDKCLNMNFSNYSNTIDLDDDESLLYYLNNDYYNNIKDKKYIVSGKFYTGSYSLVSNNYRDALNKTHTLKVGLLSLADLFAYDLENTFLINTSPDNEMSIYSVNDKHTLYENMITEKLNIRPSLYLTSNIKITDGNGSYLSPYELGGK